MIRLVLLLFVLLAPPGLVAATRTVTSLADNGAGTLRALIAQSGPGDTIDFAVSGTITLTNGELVIGRDLAINGPGATNLTVSGNHVSRVFSVAAVTLIVSGLTVANGGGINHNGGTLTVNNCTFSENAASSGGGIYNDGILTANNCTFTGNRASFKGGAIFNNGTLTANNCTVSGNHISGLGYGGGIFNSGVVTANNCTISGNTSGGFVTQGTVTIRNTIIANNSYNGDGLFISQGHNLIGSTRNSSGWTTNDLTGTDAAPLDPNLGPLQNNGGPTPTHALLPTSAAIDAGDDAVLGPPHNLLTDQRGQPRRAGEHVDIGAYEFGGATRLVTTLNDSGGGSLRNAISLAVTFDRVLFAPVVRGEIRLTGGELFIDKPLSIVGPGAATLAISGNTNSRVFHIGPLGNVDIYNLTITKGRVAGTNGTTLDDPGSAGTPGETVHGGGILNEGSLSLFDCMITSNRVVGGRGGMNQRFLPPNQRFPGSGGPGGTALGGGIYGLGRLALQRCTVVGNLAAGGAGGDGAESAAFGATGGAGGAGLAGGVFAVATATLENCTLGANQTAGGPGGNGSPTNNNPGSLRGDGGNGGVAQGGALHGAFSLRSCTVVSNSALGGPGGRHSRTNAVDGAQGAADGVGVFATSSLEVLSTVIAGNTGSTNTPDVAGTVTSAGWNLIGITDGSSGWTTNDFLGNSTFPLNALLGPCQDNGGAVWTMCPLAGSPARDKGRSELPTDARGGRRILDFPSIPNAPGGNGSDIGALEVDSLLRILSITKSNTFARVRFKSDPGGTYTLQQTSLVTNRTWTNVVTLMGNGQNLDATNSGPLPRERFYRVRSD